MQNDYFLFTRLRATQINSILAPCHSHPSFLITDICLCSDRLFFEVLSASQRFKALIEASRKRETDNLLPLLLPFAPPHAPSSCATPCSFFLLLLLLLLLILLRLLLLLPLFLFLLLLLLLLLYKM